MIYLDYCNLDAETQQRLLHNSGKEVERKFGEDLKTYSKIHQLDYNTILEEEATRNLYNYKYVFNI